MAKRSSEKQPVTSQPANTVLAASDVRAIQGLLKSKTSEGVTLALSQLQSQGATTADYEAVFTTTVMKQVLNSWLAESWKDVGKALVPHAALSEVFQKMAEEAFLKRPSKHVEYNGLLLSGMPVARQAFLAIWGDATNSSKPFIDLACIPAGSFTMGSHDEHQGCVEVQLTKPFKISRTVVTQGQWRAVMGIAPWRYGDLPSHQCGDDFPAVHVTWDEALLFCQTLTGLEREAGRLTGSQTYRLPTEAEWEYTCRAGTKTAYSFGDDPEELGCYGWYLENSDNKLQPIAWKRPNPWGLFDMHGNVWEWCGDWYAEKLEGGDDPVGPSFSGFTVNRVTRGGGGRSTAGLCRSTSRNGCIPSLRVVLSRGRPKTILPLRSNHCGFRVVLVE